MGRAANDGSELCQPRRVHLLEVVRHSKPFAHHPPCRGEGVLEVTWKSVTIKKKPPTVIGERTVKTQPHMTDKTATNRGLRPLHARVAAAGQVQRHLRVP